MEEKNINNAIKKIFSRNFRLELKNIQSPYGKGGASKKIVDYLQKIKKKDLKKDQI